MLRRQERMHRNGRYARMEARAKKVKMIFIPKSNGRIETIKHDTDNDAIYRTLGCSVIDMFEVGQSGKAPNVVYDFIIDDEGSSESRVGNPRALARGRNASNQITLDSVFACGYFDHFYLATLDFQQVCLYYQL